MTKCDHGVRLMRMGDRPGPITDDGRPIAALFGQVGLIAQDSGIGVMYRRKDMCPRLCCLGECLLFYVTPQSPLLISQ